MSPTHLCSIDSSDQLTPVEWILSTVQTIINAVIIMKKREQYFRIRIVNMIYIVCSCVGLFSMTTVVVF